MKKIALILLSLTITLTAGWWRTYGGTGTGYCVQILSDGNYVIAGRKDPDLWVLKVDTSGDVIWSNTYGGTSPGLSTWIEETSGHDFVITSLTPSLIKLDPQGDSLWIRDYGINSTCVQETSDSCYIVIGGFDSLRMIKTDSDGNEIWTHSHAEQDQDYSYGCFIQETNDKGFIITGVTGSGNEYYWFEYLWLLKTDKDGNMQWSRKYGTGEDGDINIGWCVRQTNDGGYIITGYTNSFFGAVWVLKTDEAGDTTWTKIYISSRGGEGYNVQLTDDGGYIIAAGNHAHVSSLLDETVDLWLLKLDSLGDTLWTRFYGGEGVDRGYCVQPSDDGGYIITGSLAWDLWLLKTDSLGLLVVEEQSPPETQPTFEVVTAVGKFVLLFSQGEKRSQLGIFDASGRLVDELLLDGPGTISWGDGFSPGVYFIRELGKSATTHKVVLVR